MRFLNFWKFYVIIELEFKIYMIVEEFFRDFIYWWVEVVCECSERNFWVSILKVVNIKC